MTTRKTEEGLLGFINQRSAGTSRIIRNVLMVTTVTKLTIELRSSIIQINTKLSFAPATSET
jgi:hypothetical protein